jgi:long-chain-fatty-acid--CoA ligase ACSBG
MRDKTAEVIDSDGYLRTGDIGKLVEIHDPNIDKTYQFLQINGRLKELLITSGGENISPTLIENEVKSMITVLSNCVVIGDKRNYLSMLISLKVYMDILYRHNICSFTCLYFYSNILIK